MAPFHNILVPVDFSKHSERALQVACDLAKTFQIPLTVMHAYALPAYPLPEGYVLASSETVAEILSKTQHAMNEARAKATAMGVPDVSIVMSEGAPFAEIVRVAREQGSDLIVIATHGRSGLKHALLGSVTEKVVRKAPCAVLTLRDSEMQFQRP